MRSVNPIVLAMILIAASAVAVAGEFKREISKTLAFQPGDRLSIKAYKGSIHLTSWDRNQIEIHATIEAPPLSDSEYAREGVERTRVDISESSSGVRIKSDYEDVPSSSSGWFWSRTRILPFVHYQIRAPRNLSLRIDDHKSEIELFGLDGRIDVETHKGRVEGNDLIGQVRIDTHKGEVRLEAVSGGMKIDTHKGDIFVQANRIDEDSSFHTHKGTIVLDLPENLRANIRADLSKRGALRSEFDFDRHRRGRYSWDAQINGGGPSLRFSTHKGTFRLRN